MVTANGEVQTNEEAQVYVHHVLDLFVTVQILDDTFAVLSFGKLCEEHGYSTKWTSGQKPHLAPVRVLHRYSRTHQEHLQVQRKCEVTMRHWETGAIAQKVKTNSKRGTNMRQWETACETSQRGVRSSQNLEETEMPAIGHISHDSDSERPMKVASKKRSFFLTFRKTEIPKSACEPK